MARARLLKPGFFTNEDLCECPPLARLLFAGLWTIADREGRLDDRPKRIKAELFPYDNDVEVPALLDELEEHGFIQRYKIESAHFIQIVNFDKHQHPHHREPDSIIPAPVEPRAGLGLGTVEPRANTGLAPTLPQPSPAVSGDPVSGDPVAVAERVSAREDAAPPAVAALSEAQPESKRRRPLGAIEAELPSLCEDFPGVDVRRELAKFQDWLRSKNKSFTDYVAAFRNWLRKAEEYERARVQANGHAAGRTKYLDGADELERRLAAR